jgi:hypothetical protein
MSINEISSPVTGAAQTGFTSATYTVVEDKAPDVNAVQYAVIELGGTQTGVSVHSASNPFTLTVTRPKVIRNLGNPDSSGIYRKVPVNTYTVLTRKGVDIGNTKKETSMVRTRLEIPAGADVDAEQVRAALALHIGALTQLSASLGDMAVSGLMQ